jgi:hypothetical protein
MVTKLNLGVLIPFDHIIQKQDLGIMAFVKTYY